MEAKDTLMTFKEQTEEMKTAKVKPGCLVRKQAEITWDIAFKAGIKEVVDWVMKYRSETTREFMGFTMSRVEWQANLKEWGLE